MTKMVVKKISEMNSISFHFLYCLPSPTNCRMNGSAMISAQESTMNRMQMQFRKNAVLDDWGSSSVCSRFFSTLGTVSESPSSECSSSESSFCLFRWMVLLADRVCCFPGAVPMRLNSLHDSMQGG